MLAHAAFERGEFDKAERGYAEVIALTPERDPARADLVERQAAAIYKQGEQARAANKPQDAVGHFARIAAVAPQSAVRADRAVRRRSGADRAEGLGRRDQDAGGLPPAFPHASAAAEVGNKLAVAYLEKGNWAQAAGEFERVASTSKDPKLAREAQWQAARTAREGSREGRLAGTCDQGPTNATWRRTPSRWSAHSKPATGLRSWPKPTATAHANWR